MLILLPPSETKRAGGDGPPLRMSALALSGLDDQRERVVAALAALSADPERAARALKLTARRRDEIAVNARVRSSPTLPAVDRYTGVLYDALDAASLAADARGWLGRHVMIQSAPFGPVGALDQIPAYRLAAGTSLPGVAPLRRLWAQPVTAALAEAAPALVIDLRSEAYAALGPIPAGIPAAYVRVVTAGPDGAVRALNHFNKRAKGLLVRALAGMRAQPATLAEAADAVRSAGFPVREHGGEWLLDASKV